MGIQRETQFIFNIGNHLEGVAQVTATERLKRIGRRCTLKRTQNSCVLRKRTCETDISMNNIEKPKTNGGLNLNQKNCFDMQYLILKELKYRREHNSTPSSQSTVNLKKIVGPLERFATANNAVVGEWLYQPG